MGICLSKLKCYHLSMLDKKKIKEELERERDEVLAQMQDIGKMNPETGEWEATPEEIDFPEADQNDAADRFEDFEERSSMIRDLGTRLNNILTSLKDINKVKFAKCEVCGKEIESDRLGANPAAKTCKTHLEG